MTGSAPAARHPLTALVALMSAQSAVYGARLTGAGFGGACVALCRKQCAASAGRTVVQRFNADGHSARMVVPLN
ncbi:galactokinase [compost metagenome]